MFSQLLPILAPSTRRWNRKFRDNVAVLLTSDDSRMAIDHSPWREMVFVANRTANCARSREPKRERERERHCACFRICNGCVDTRFCDGWCARSLRQLFCWLFLKGKLLNEIGREVNVPGTLREKLRVIITYACNARSFRAFLSMIALCCPANARKVHIEIEKLILALSHRARLLTRDHNREILILRNSI